LSNFSCSESKKKFWFFFGRPLHFFGKKKIAPDVSNSVKNDQKKLLSLDRKICEKLIEKLLTFQYLFFHSKKEISAVLLRKGNKLNKSFTKLSVLLNLTIIVAKNCSI